MNPESSDANVGRRPVKASVTERASIRALKHWLLSTPADNPLQDQIVRLRLADAIASVTRRAGPPKQG